MSHSRLAILPGLILSRYSSKVMRTMCSCSTFSKMMTPPSHTEPPHQEEKWGGRDVSGSSFLPPGIPVRKNLLPLRYLLAISSVQEVQFEGQLESELVSSSSHEICKMLKGDNKSLERTRYLFLINNPGGGEGRWRGEKVQ